MRCYIVLDACMDRRISDWIILQDVGNVQIKCGQTSMEFKGRFPAPGFCIHRNRTVCDVDVKFIEDLTIIRCLQQIFITDRCARAALGGDIS